jgi:site-specific recombinase XerD
MPLDVIHIKREHIESFILWQLEDHKPSSVQTRFRGCHVFFSWLVWEGEIKENPMRLMQQPKFVESSPDILTEDQLRAILNTCKSNSFEDRRDTAIIRVLIDTPLRRSELTNIKVEDINWKLNVI